MRKDILKEIRKLKRELKKILMNDLIDIRLYGSRVKGNFHFWSDLDVLIVVKKKTKKIYKLITEFSKTFEEKFGFSLHPLIFNEKDWQKEYQLQTEFARSILKEGLKV
jgi:predicted nucleotidyltransferase